MSHRRYKTKNVQTKGHFTTFTPRSKLESSHSLISNHMKAHYNRIASVQAKTDSRPPVSMQKATKVRDRQKMQLDGSGMYHKPFLNLSFGSSTHTVDLAVDSSAGFSDTSSGDEESAVTQTEQWRNYVTKTGRLTGYINSSRKISPVKDGRSRKETWKPAFSLNSTGTIHAFYPSLNQSATDGHHNCTVNTKPKNRRSIAVNNEISSSQTSPTIEAYTGHEVQTPLCSSPIKHVTDIELEKDRIKMYKRQEELEYLGFISGITQDILSRQYLSDTALELLIGCHIERNIHKLDKNKMMEMVTELKEQLGFKSTQ